MHQSGFTNAVASLGTSLTSGHASLLKRYTQEVLLLYDSDEAGVKAALRAIPILREAGINSRVVDLKPHKDPDEFIKTEGAEAFQQRLDQARDSFMFRVSVSEKDFPMEEPQGQNRFFERCARLLLELSDELERNLYIEAIVRRYSQIWDQRGGSPQKSKYPGYEGNAYRAAAAAKDCGSPSGTEEGICSR